MAKLLGEKAVFNRLQKELDKRFTEEQQEFIGFANDIEGEKSHTWVCEHEGKTFHLICNKVNGKVEYKEFGTTRKNNNVNVQY